MRLFVAYLVKHERNARNGALLLIAAIVLILVGQYFGASSVANVMRDQRIDDWSKTSAAHAIAVKDFYECYRSNSGSEVTTRACVNKAASGQMASELYELTFVPPATIEALPWPLQLINNL